MKTQIKARLATHIGPWRVLHQTHTPRRVGGAGPVVIVDGERLQDRRRWRRR